MFEKSADKLLVVNCQLLNAVKQVKSSRLVDWLLRMICHVAV